MGDNAAKTLHNDVIIVVLFGTRLLRDYTAAIKWLIGIER